MASTRNDNWQVGDKVVATIGSMKDNAVITRVYEQGVALAHEGGGYTLLTNAEAQRMLCKVV